MRQLPPDDYSSESETNYEYYRRRMERRLVTQVYDRGRFDDICQDAFVKALTYLARQDATKLPQTDYHLGNLLCDMAVKVAIDDYRKNRSKAHLLLSEIEDTQLLKLMVEGDENQICNLEELQEAIVQLPLQQHDIVRAMLQGLKQKDIAIELDISPSTVSKYVRLARAELRKKIYPVPIDLRRAEILKAFREIKRHDIDAIAIFNRDLLELRYTGHSLYTEKQLRGMDEHQFLYIVMERHYYLYAARGYRDFYTGSALKIIVERNNRSLHSRD